MVMKGFCLHGQEEDARETSKPSRCLVRCCIVIHLMSPMRSWFASWRSPSKFWALSIHLECRFSIWHSSIRCEVFLNWFPEKKKKSWKRYRQKCIYLFTILRVPLDLAGRLRQFEGLLTWPCCLI